METNINEMEPAEALRHLRGLYGMRRSEFCAHVGIPLRSLQHWEIGDRKPAPFVVGLLYRCYELEQENARLRGYADAIDRQNEELKSLLKSGEVAL